MTSSRRLSVVVVLLLALVAGSCKLGDGGTEITAGRSGGTATSCSSSKCAAQCEKTYPAPHQSTPNYYCRLDCTGKCTEP